MALTAPQTIQEKIDAKNSAKTVWQTDQKDWVHLNIPAENALGEKHDTMGLNTHYFEAGKSYLVPQEVYDTITQRLAVYARATVRVLQPKRDYSAENAVAIGSVNSRATQAVDPSTLKD